MITIPQRPVILTVLQGTITLQQDVFVGLSLGTGQDNVRRVFLPGAT
jgi:hypothetical protein